MGLHTSQVRRYLLAAAISQVFVVAPALALPAQANQTSSDDQAIHEKPSEKKQEPITLKTVVVTAQRRKQDIQKVPVAVTAIDQAQLNRRGIRNVADLSGAAPSLIMVPEPGTASAVAVEIRGTFRSNPAMYWDTPVGMYVDGVYIGKTAGNVFDLLNLQRVEVLRGPQGTLFGRNTMAGAVNLITNPPSGQFTGRATVGLGNYGSKVAKVMMDLPAMGKLKASVGARIERRDGWVKTTPGSAEPDLANKNNESALVALEYDATDNLTFTYRFDYSKINQRGLFNQAIHSNILGSFGIPGIIVNPDRQTTASIDAPDFERAKVEGNSLTATWKLGRSSTIKYIGAYRSLRDIYALDLDGSPIPFAQSLSANRYHQISHELQYLGSSGPWDWVAGLYFFKDDGYTYNPQVYFFGQVDYNQSNSFGTRSRAIYGQVDYKLTDKLTLTGGWRRTLEDKQAGRFQELLGPPVYVTIPEGTAAQTSSGATTPMLAVTYQATPGHMVYFRYAKGFMGGGFNGDAQSVISAVTPFRPEFQTTYEVGSKNTLWGGKLSLDGDIFFNRSTDLQGQVFNAQGAAGSIVVNVGRSKSHGLELAARLRATRDLSLVLNYGYINGGGAPHNTANLVLDDVLARTSVGVVRATIDYRFVSGYSGITNTVFIPAQRIANGRIALSGMDWGKVSGEVAFWIKNITNESHTNTIVDFGPGFGSLRVANFSPPRTFGVELSARW